VYIREDTEEEQVQINLMPMIDMVFLLLIFFLVASTFAQQESQIAIELPVASQDKPLSASPKQLVINILADGSTIVGGRKCATEQLQAILTQAMQQRQERVVFIRADASSRHREFAAAVRACREAGVKQMKIGYIVQESDASADR
jgi:biopolymer transport protein ExbD